MRLCLFLLAASLLPAQSNPLRALSSQFQSLVEKADPAIVQILVRALNSEENPGPILKTSRGNGSGVLVSSDGYIVTNAHVVANARRIQVLVPQSVDSAQRQQSVLKSSGKLYSATLVGQDKETDIAVLKIEEKNLPFLTFGNSETLRQGQLVFAFGSPLGLDNSVTMGIVSSVARQVRSDDPMIYIQTDAAINPGNSGGPLIDADGQVVGINTFILSQNGGSDGIGFAAPSNIVKTVVEQIRSSGRVRRGQIGITTSTVTPLLAQALGLAQDTGVLLDDVAPGSAAAAAGLKIGDLVTAINDKPTENSRQLGVNIYQAAGQTIELTVLRGKESMKIGVAVLERPQDPDRLLSLLKGDENRIRKLGVLALDLDEKVIPLFTNLREYTGAVVAGVTTDLAVDALHLAPGDIIHQVGKTRILNLATLRQAVQDLPHGEIVALQIERQSRFLFVLIEID